MVRAVADNASRFKVLVGKINRIFFLTIVLEHLAFLALIASGVALALRFGFWGQEWLNAKLLIVGVIIVPLEIVDVLLGNWLAAKASEKYFSGKNLSAFEQRCLTIYHGLFTKIALLIIPLSVVAVMFIAISKMSI